MKLEASLRDRAKVNNQSALVEDLRTRERTLCVNLEYVESKRDSFRGLMEVMKKELLGFEVVSVYLSIKF